MRALLLAAAVAAGSACSAQETAPPSATVPVGGTRAPVEQGRAQTDFRPAAPGQTRAPQPAQDSAVQVTTVAQGLDHPWAVEVLPDGRFLVTEKPGRMRIVARDGTLGPPLQGLPAVHARGQAGLLDVALAPDFARSGRIYWTYSEPREGGRNGTAVATGLLRGAQPTAIDDVRVIFRVEPSWPNNLHYGSRLVFAPDGTLFVTTGERSDPEPRQLAQDLNTHFGKILRLNADGTPARGNPFAGRQGARPEIWSYGHRNTQSAALDPQGRLWIVEHGPRGGDELNRPEAGRNYGWPIVSYGEEYSGAPIGRGVAVREGMEQPVYYWDPVIAPSGMVFYSGSLFPQWRGNALVGGLRRQALVRLVMDGDRVAAEEHIPIGARVRDVVQGPGGAVYLATDEDNGRILRLTPRG